MTVQRTSTATQYPPWIEALRPELKNSNDRSLIIVSSALLHECLMELAVMHLLPSPTAEDSLFHDRKPNSTLSATIDLCVRLGIVDSAVANVLTILRRMRNDCAHSTRQVSIMDPPFCDQARELISRFRMFDGENGDLRSQFIVVVMNIIGLLAGGVDNIKLNSNTLGRRFGCALSLRDRALTTTVYPRNRHPLEE